MTTEEIWIGEDDVRRKLEGDELQEFLNVRAQMAADKAAENAAIEASAAAKASAKTKLAALGLTADEISALSK